MTDEEFLKTHDWGKTDLREIADRIKSHRSEIVRLNGSIVGVAFYLHESADVEAALRAAHDAASNGEQK